MFLASVIGFEFSLETLLKVYPFENNQKKFIHGEIDALQTLGLLRSAHSEGDPIYTFENKRLLEVRTRRHRKLWIFILVRLFIVV